MRKDLQININGEILNVSGKKALMPLSDFLRDDLGLVGTKVVCSEGDCGACTVLVAHPYLQSSDGPKFKAINSCISYLLALDGCTVVTIEGVKRKSGSMSAVQSEMVNHHGSQCGFCTPGIVMSLTGLFEEKDLVERRHIKNALTGNLCRCTGYEPIIVAGENVKKCEEDNLSERYLCDSLWRQSTELAGQSAHFSGEGWEVYSPTTIEEVLDLKDRFPRASFFSGGTDLGVLLNKDRLAPTTFINLNLVKELFEVSFESEGIMVGAKVTFGKLEEYLKKQHQEFLNLIHIFASPQIKNYGTLVGNIANGSPIGDSLPYLFVSGAELELRSKLGKRRVKVEEFYKGYKTFDLKANELITKVIIPQTKEGFRYKLYKTSQRKDLDISCVTLGVLYRAKEGVVEDLKLAIGGVGPTVLRLKNTESKILELGIELDTIEQVRSELLGEISPMTDVRGSKEFRQNLSMNLLKKFAYDFAGGFNEVQ